MKLADAPVFSLHWVGKGARTVIENGVRAGKLEPLPKSMWLDAGMMSPLRLRHGPYLHRVLGIPDSVRGSFTPPDGVTYFLECLHRLDQSPRDYGTGPQSFASETYYRTVRNFIVVWMYMNERARPNMNAVSLVWEPMFEDLS